MARGEREEEKKSQLRCVVRLPADLPLPCPVSQRSEQAGRSATSPSSPTPTRNGREGVGTRAVELKESHD